MARQATGTASGMRLALFAAALLLAIGAMLALAATATAQDPGDNANQNPSPSTEDSSGPQPADNGGDGQGSGGSSQDQSSTAPSDDDDDQAADDDDDQSADGDASQNECRGMVLRTLQDRYHARANGSEKAGTDKLVAAIPLSDRLTDVQRRCALAMQDAKHPNLRWGFQTRCPRNHIFSFRPTGASRTIDGVEFRQWERIEDYKCTSRWSPLMTDGSKPPSGLIPPSDPISIITVKYRVRLWIQWSGFDRASVPDAPASESTLAE